MCCVILVLITTCLWTAWGVSRQGGRPDWCGPGQEAWWWWRRRWWWWRFQCSSCWYAYGHADAHAHAYANSFQLSNSQSKCKKFSILSRILFWMINLVKNSSVVVKLFFAKVAYLYNIILITHTTLKWMNIHIFHSHNSSLKAQEHFFSDLVLLLS